MAKPQSFRFAIADTVPRSECWSFFTKGDDVYLTGHQNKKLHKVSLHQSGVCQIALLQSFFEANVNGVPNGPKDRTILRWRRLMSQHEKGNVTLEMLFASSGPWQEQEPIPASKNYTKISPPEEGFGRLVSIVFTLDDPWMVARKGNWPPDMLIHSQQLPNGEYVCILQELRPLNEGFWNPRPPLASHFITNGMPEDLNDDDDCANAFECYQVHEGSVRVLLTHNVKLVVEKAPILQRLISLISRFLNRRKA